MVINMELQHFYNSSFKNQTTNLKKILATTYKKGIVHLQKKVSEVLYLGFIYK